MITLEPALKMLNHTTWENDCPGIGNEGKPLKKTINECFYFLKKLSDVPALLTTIVLDSETFNNIRNDQWFINYSINNSDR